jgi:hypothetical protein
MEEQLIHQEKWAILVDGIHMPGFNSQAEAQGFIDRDPDLKKKGALAVPLGKSEESWPIPVF